MARINVFKILLFSVNLVSLISCFILFQGAEISFNSMGLDLKGGEYHNLFDFESRCKPEEDSQNSSLILASENVNKEQQILGASTRVSKIFSTLLCLIT